MKPGITPYKTPPFHELDPLVFESLCRDLVASIPNVISSEIYGRSGQKQYGIDIVAQLDNGEAWTIQCKDYEKISSRNLSTLSDTYIKHINFWRKLNVVKFILCLGCEIDDTKVLDEVQTQTYRFRTEHNMEFEVWSAATLQAKLRDKPEIVQHYCKPSFYWLEHICGIVPVESAVKEAISTLVKTYKTTPETQDLSPFQREKYVLANRMKAAWIVGRLQHSLSYDSPLEIESIDSSPLCEGERTTVAAKFELIKDGTRLTILGDPGAGKTTAMLLIADGMLEELQSNVKASVPILFPLARYTGNKNLKDWIIQELCDQTFHYKVSKSFAKELITRQELVVLLDGLDEVPETQRNLHIESIHEFLESSANIGLILTCRTNEYARLSSKFASSSTLTLQPLSNEQIVNALNSERQGHSKLIELTSTSEDWKKIARIPLMLNLMLVAFQDAGPSLSELTKNNDVVAYILESYVQRVLSGNRRVAPAQVQSTLALLSKVMEDKNETTFFLEFLQPYNLPKEASNRYMPFLYVVMFVLVCLFFGGWLLGSFIMAAMLAAAFPSAYVAFFYPLIILAIMIAYSRSLAGKSFEAVELVDKVRLNVEGARKFFSGRFGRARLSAWRKRSHCFALLLAVLMAVFAIFTAPLFTQQKILSVETLVFVCIVLTFGYLEALLIAGAIVFVKMAWEFWTEGIFAASSVTLDPHIRAHMNAGIWNSFWSSFYAGSVSFAGMLLFNTIIAFLFGQTNPMLVLSTPLLTFPWILPIVLGFGGKSFLKHFIMRFLLWKYCALPFRLDRVLAYCCDAQLLYGVGNGVMFKHRLFQEYFLAISKS